MKFQDDDEDEDGQATALRAQRSADLWELAQYVEEHPEDLAERWRLAKKMYLSWEYRHALEHLAVLKNEWPTRLNVIRYLAATYYRLGRYDDASAELVSALQRWPEDVGLREQLARVKEIAGDRKGASEVWEEIAAISPAHPTAESSIRRLHAPQKNTSKEDLGIGDSDSGVDLKMGIICGQCGAQNSNEESRCWQCNEPLTHLSPPPSRRSLRPGSPVAMGPSIETLVAMTGFVGLLFAGFCVYLSILLMLGDRSTADRFGYQTLWDLYQHGMGRTRLTLGATLYLGWPFALWSAINFFRVPLRIPPAFVTLTAFAAAGLAFLCTWLPANSLWLFVVLPPGGTALLIFGAYQLAPRQAAAVWATHLAIMALLVPLSILISERIQFGAFYNPVTELSRVLAFASAEGNAATGSGRLTLEDEEVPIMRRLRWTSTGSAWLDARAGETTFSVSSARNGELILEIKDSTGTRLYEDVRNELWSTTFPVAPDEVYEVYVRGPAGAKATLEIGGLMRCTEVP